MLDQSLKIVAGYFPLMEAVGCSFDLEYDNFHTL